MSYFFNPGETVNKGRGGSLPHWRQDRKIYFVTFRLADSLPQKRLTALREQRAAWMARPPEPHTQAETNDFHDQFTQPIHDWMDRGYGSMILMEPDLREMVIKALQHFEATRYQLDSWVVAANHVHALVIPTEGNPLSQILHTWKSFTAHEILKAPAASRLSTIPIVWQSESWDHIVRSERSLEQFRHYIRSHAEYLG